MIWQSYWHHVPRQFLRQTLNLGSVLQKSMDDMDGCSEGNFFPGIAKQVLFESDFSKTSRPSFLKMVL